MTDSACANITRSLAMAMNADARPNASATDAFDAKSTAWTAAGTSTSAWTHLRKTALHGAFHSDDLAANNDVQLVSPPLSATDPVVVELPTNLSTDTVTLDFGTLLAGITFQLRFRIGSDDALGARGWTNDNVAVTGIPRARAEQLQW